MGTPYHFDIDHATLYGVDEAIMIANLQYWIRHNLANKKHQYDDRTWTYNSVEAFGKLFPFWSRRQIDRILTSLIDAGVIIKGNYSASQYDRTSWFAFVDEALFVSIDQHFTKPGNASTLNGNNHFTKRGNAISPNGEMPFHQTGKSYIDTDNKPNNKPNKGSRSRDHIVDKSVDKPVKRLKFDKVMIVDITRRLQVNDFVPEEDRAYLAAYRHQEREKLKNLPK